MRECCLCVYDIRTCAQFSHKWINKIVKGKQPYPFPSNQCYICIQMMTTFELLDHKGIGSNDTHQKLCSFHDRSLHGVQSQGTVL